MEERVIRVRPIDADWFRKVYCTICPRWRGEAHNYMESICYTCAQRYLGRAKGEIEFNATNKRTDSGTDAIVEPR